MKIMKPLKVAICDDNPQERKFFCNMCKLVKERQNIQIKLKEYETGESMIFDLGDTRTMNTVDIVLLDINMPDKSGIEIAQILREYGYQGAIIFITKSNKHWSDAFDVEAFNYIRKDTGVAQRFLSVFMKAIEKAKQRRDRTLIFSSIGEARQIEIATISRFTVNVALVTVHYGDESFEFSSTLNKIESLLEGRTDFMRVHRSCIVSLPHIEKIQKNDIVMNDGSVVPVSPKNVKTLKAKMKE